MGKLVGARQIRIVHSEQPVSMKYWSDVRDDLMNRIALTAALMVMGLQPFGGLQASAAELPTACAYLSSSMDAQSPEPLFLASYPTVKSGPLQGAAFLYDNAVATIALAACGEIKKAARIGDAILAALDRDRYWHDGRLRNGYLAGPIGPGPVKLAGWWDANQNMWVEDRYQVGSDNGNMAWAVLALLALDHATGDHRYRDGAARIGGWIKQWRGKTSPGGFTGGTFAHEPAPVVEAWKSTEHNTDLAAAFTALARVTGDKTWLVEARAARNFVRAMWRPKCGCFAVGTTEDGKTRNLYLALDAQIWPLLAIPGDAARDKAAMAPSKLRDGDGFAYSEAKEGLWTEGTAQVALLLELSGRLDEADGFMKAVDTMRAPDGSYYAASTRELPTGFMLETDPTQPRQYFHIAHLAAVSWVAIAGRRYNPFTGTNALP
jgi:hypothetical protein